MAPTVSEATASTTLIADYSATLAAFSAAFSAVSGATVKISLM
jgi:hypothetical protein